MDLSDWLYMWHRWRHAVWNARDWAGQTIMDSAERAGIERGWWWVKLRGQLSYGAAMSDYHHRRRDELKEYLMCRAMARDQPVTFTEPPR